jgi:serine phosphatase RsbU (regulator of sigma subunit)/pSer/pThr/pTyr-binding forkhead associated (FHA) protein
MASLITVRGPNQGRRFPLDERESIIGRQPDATIYLESLAVSRVHARVNCEGGACYVEDLGSSNGTYVNGMRIAGRVRLTDRDTLQIGPYEMNLVGEVPSVEPPQVIRAQVEVQPSNLTIFSDNPAQKLERMLTIAHDLSQDLDIDSLLSNLLQHLLRLFSQADRGMALLCEGDRLIVRAQHQRHGDAKGDYGYSRTIVKKALAEGAALLSEDVREDRNLPLSQTMVSLNLRSFLCVPLIGREGKRLGVIQLDCTRSGQSFKKADLDMLTAIGMQAALVLQNAAYHAERLKEERMRQELLLARDIQQQFLPHDFSVAGDTAELYANCVPAREVSGDLYDFFKLPDGRLAFFVGDVSGKGTPAALFMIAVRTLARYLAPTVTGPADFLWRINNALADDNPTHLYVTMACGIYDPRDGGMVVSRAGHPDPLWRKADGTVTPLDAKPGMMLGSTSMPKIFHKECRLVLGLGETLAMYTDGYHEAENPAKDQFGVQRLCEALAGPLKDQSLQAAAEAASERVRAYTGPCDQQDDMTLLMLRRRVVS